MHAGESRVETGSIPIVTDLTDACVDGDVEFNVELRSLADGLVVRGHATTEALLRCSSCLTEWRDQIRVPIETVFRLDPDDADEERPIGTGGWIDLEPSVHDEVSLTLPTAPRCKDDCRGLCPVCGNDLNTDPCDGHDEVTLSPFAVLQGLIDEGDLDRATLDAQPPDSQ